MAIADGSSSCGWDYLTRATASRYDVASSRAVRTERSPSPFPTRESRRSRGHRLARFATEGGIRKGSPVVFASAVVPPLRIAGRGPGGEDIGGGDRGGGQREGRIPSRDESRLKPRLGPPAERARRGQATAGP